MDFYLDECLSKRVAHSLDAFDEHHRVFSVKELFKGTKDFDLVRKLNERNADVLITQDVGFKKRVYQYEAYNANKLSVLTVKVAQGSIDNIQWQYLVKNWERVIKICKKEKKPFVIRLLNSPDQKTGKGYNVHRSG